MKFKEVKKFQMGGAAPQGGEDPTQVLLQGAQQALQSQDCQMAMQVCQMLVEALGGASAEGGVPAAPGEGEAPAEPVYRRGGRLVRRISKN